MIFWDLPSTSQCISKSLSGSTEPSLDGRSRTCPKDAMHLVAAAQVFVDRLGLGGRFDDDDVHLWTFRLAPLDRGARKWGLGPPSALGVR